MVKKLLMYMKRLCLYLLIVTIGIPLSFLVAAKAQAAEKLLAPDVTKVVLKQNPQGQSDLIFGLPGTVRAESVVQASADKTFQNIIGSAKANSDGSIPTILLGDNVSSMFYLRATFGKNVSPQITLLNDITPPVIKGLDNLKAANYAQGQSIVMRFSAEAGLEAWANIGVLDESFPQKIRVNYVDGGLLELRTPKLTNALIPGKHLIKISAKDSAGNWQVKEIPLNLIAPAKPEIVYIKVDNFGSIYPVWQPMKNAKQYTIEWREQGAGEIGEKLIDGRYTSTKISGLNPGTNYEVKITAIYFDGGVSPSSKSIVKTPGEKPAKMVLAATEVKTAPKITPAIGEGIATAKPVKQVQAQETTKPADKAKEEETSKGGWNRLLVALSILIIAAGIAVGGYYGYEWMQTKSKDTDTPSKERW